MTLTLMKDWTFVTAAMTSLFPLGAFVLIMLFTRSRAKLSARLSIGSVTGSLAGAVFLLVRHWHLESPIQYTGRWMVSGTITVPVGFLLDPLSLLMLTIVTVICFLVQIYSLGYMAGDRGFSRYYAFMSLFAIFHVSVICLLGTGGPVLLFAHRFLVRKIQCQRGGKESICHDPFG
jgi:NADH-quinone oxidoreductase subunit L